MTSGTRSWRLSVVAFLLACLPVVLVWVPFGGRSTVISGDANGPDVMIEERVSSLASEGWTVLVPFVVGAVLALVPVLVARRRVARATRIVVAGLFGLGVFAAFASIGMFFVPALIALCLAAGVETVPPPSATG